MCLFFFCCFYFLPVLIYYCFSSSSSSSSLCSKTAGIFVYAQNCRKMAFGGFLQGPERLDKRKAQGAYSSSCSFCYSSILCNLLIALGLVPIFSFPLFCPLGLVSIFFLFFVFILMLLSFLVFVLLLCFVQHVSCCSFPLYVYCSLLFYVLVFM